MTLRRKATRARERWTLLVAMVATLVLAVGAVTLAVHDVGEFELDKDASNELNTFPVGYLSSNINDSTTSINVCETAVGGDFDPVPVAGDILLIRGERMELEANDAGNFGGNCPGVKRTYTVERGFDETTAIAQSGGANNIGARVSLIRDATLPDGPDWDQVYASVTADLNDAGDDDKCIAYMDGDDTVQLGLVECTFVEDGIGPTIYTQGSTKDHLPISGWFHTDGASPDKGEILNAYAAKAIDEGGDEILYFGMDRYAVDGSTDIGFWFFQSQVLACPDAENEEACEGVPDGEFAGEHVDGDLLILGTFTQGGATSNVRVYTWTGDAETGTAVGPTDTFGDCVPGEDEDEGCATVNNTTIEVDWNYTFKGEATGGWVPAGGAFEGGINLTDNNLQGCFSSFLAETRSSPEITAILKDFALGQFESCDTELTTTPSDDGGTAIGSGGISIGTGSVLVKDSADLEVKGIAEWTGTLSFYLCGPDTGLCETGGTLISSHNVTQASANPFLSDAAEVTSAGDYCWRAVFESGTEGVPGAEDATEGECFTVNPVTPTLTTTAGSAVEIGTAVTDTATLTGTANQPGDPVINPTEDGGEADGNITFTLYDSDCEPIAASEQSVTVSGDSPPDYGPASFDPGATGTYHWVASYDGDSPNTNPTSHNAPTTESTGCTDAAETVKVVDAYIELDPLTATNEVNEQHEITAIVWQDPGTGTFEAAPDGTEVTFSLLANNAGAAFVGDDDTCTTVDGECSVFINTTTAGSVDIHAETSVLVEGVTIERETDGTGNNSDDANKIYVDASIAISPLDDTNNIDNEHVFTITVTALPSDADVTFDSITASISPAPDSYDDSDCDTPTVVGNVASCEVTINHGSAETFTLNATALLTIEGEQITRDTDPDTLDIGSGPDGSGHAEKEFVDGSLTWLKWDQDDQLLGGATFEVCQTHALDTTGAVDVLDNLDPDVCVSVTDNEAADEAGEASDEDPQDGEFLLTNLSLGTWTIRETAAPDGYAFDDELTQTVFLTIASPDGSATNPFVNTRLYKIIIFVCNESLGTLVESDVTLDGGSPTVTSGDVPEPLATAGVTEAMICAIEDGATYGDLDEGTYAASITIPRALSLAQFP